MSEKIHYCDRHMSRIFDTEYEAKQALDGIGEVYECVKVTIKPAISAASVIEQLDCDAADQGGEDFYWSDLISEADKLELQNFLDQWCSKFTAEVFEQLAPDKE